jgi:hypothetical protein
MFRAFKNGSSVMEKFKEYLEEQMDLKRVCQITFRSVQGALTTIRAHIIKMEEVSGRTIIETDGGFVIGLDQLVSVNDRVQENYC